MLWTFAACGAPDSSDRAEPDSVLVEAVALVHLQSARADVGGELVRPMHAAEEATGLDSAAIRHRLDQAARSPKQAHLLYTAVADRLETLRDAP